MGELFPTRLWGCCDLEISADELRERSRTDLAQKDLLFFLGDEICDVVGTRWKVLDSCLFERGDGHGCQL